jgi:hypothetical protein
MEPLIAHVDATAVDDLRRTFRGEVVVPLRDRDPRAEGAAGCHLAEPRGP